MRASRSAGSKPLPLTVRTCKSTGPSECAARSRAVDERVVVVAVDRADVAEADLLENDRRLVLGRDELHRADLGRSIALSWRALAERNAIEHVFPVRSRAKLANGLVRNTERYEAIEPTLGAIDISLSLRITMKLVFSAPALLSAS